MQWMKDSCMTRTSFLSDRYSERERIKESKGEDEREK